MKTELIKALGIELPEELGEFISSGIDDVSDYCHETADGCEDVIYYGKAEDLYHQASNDERDQAEYSVEDCGGFPEGIDMAQRYTILAYWIVRNRLEKAIRSQAEEIANALRDKIEELEEIADAFEEIAE